MVDRISPVHGETRHVPYGFYVFERYDFTELARDLDGVLRDAEVGWPSASMLTD